MLTTTSLYSKPRWRRHAVAFLEDGDLDAVARAAVHELELAPGDTVVLTTKAELDSGRRLHRIDTYTVSRSRELRWITPRAARPRVAAPPARRPASREPRRRSRGGRGRARPRAPGRPADDDPDPDVARRRRASRRGSGR